MAITIDTNIVTKVNVKKKFHVGYSLLSFPLSEINIFQLRDLLPLRNENNSYFLAL